MAIRLKSFVISVVLLTSNALGQRKELVNVPWAPPADLDFPIGVAPKPTVPQIMVTALRLGSMSIRLERTELAAVRERFGGEQGQRGDASTSLRWVCYGGQDAGGRWALWLTSGEIDGPSIGSFEWRRVDPNAQFDPRCALLPNGTTITFSPTLLRLGMSQQDVLHRLGSPTLRRGNILDFEHMEQQKTYSVSNSVEVRLRNGTVDFILGAETISN